MSENDAIREPRDGELGSLAREVVDNARRARTPNDAQRERAYQAMMAGIAGGGALAASKAAASGAARVSGMGLKWAASALIVVAGVGGYAWFRQRQPADVPRPQLAVSVAAPVQPVPVAPESPPVVDSSAPTPAADAPSAATITKSQSAVKASADDLVAEVSLLHDALAASRAGNASRALELATAHARRFPNSRLSTERDAIEVRSLCALGRAPEARRIAERLRARAPNSPTSAALAETCVGK